MQKAKGMQYAMAGVQMAPNMRMNVRSHVYVPDAEAGCEQEGYRKPYYAAQQAERPHGPLTVSYRVAIPFLVGLFLLFFGLTAGKLAQRVTLADEIDTMETHISALIVENLVLRNEVELNRDQARISYLAQSFGMVSSNGVDTVPVIAPETRPQQIENSLTGNSPLPGGHGMISGSR